MLRHLCTQGMRREEDVEQIRGHVRCEGIGESAEVLPVCGELQGDDEGCEQIQGVLGGGRECEREVKAE